MNKNVLMIMGGAFVVAIVVAMIVQAKLSPKDPKSAGTMTEVLVAAKSLQTGSVLKERDVKWQAWPEKSMFKGLIKKSDQVDEKDIDVYDVPLRRNLQAGEPVTRQALIPDIKGGNNFLAASIAPGMRAVAIGVKANTSAGGFVAPGDRVDVILSYAPRLQSGAKEYSAAIVQQYASQTILHNVKVLAVDQNAADEGREAKVAKTVTLEVSKEGAEVLALGDRMGDITLALRRIGDNEVPAPDARSITTDATTSQVIRKVNDAMYKGKTGNSIRLYSGNSIQNVPVRAAPDETKKAGN